MGNNSSKIKFDDFGPNFPQDVHLMKLRNLGNTCYANSILQSLLNNSYVVALLKSIHRVIEMNPLLDSIRESPLYYLIKINFQKMNSKTREIFIVPKDFIDSVAKQAPNFKIGVQHDSHEFFVYLLSSFDDTINEINKHFNSNIKPFSEMFSSHSITTQECLMCGYKSQTEEDFNCFYLSIKERRSLNSRLKNSQSPDYLQGSGKRYCNKCRIKQEMKIQCTYTKIPSIVVFQLQRFEFDRATRKMKKLLQHIPFPSAIDLNGKHYNLSSIVVHIGAELSSGHFIAVMWIHEKWILASDSTINVLNNHQVEEFFAVGEGKGPYAPSAYLLFYEEIQGKKQ